METSALTSFVDIVANFVICGGKNKKKDNDANPFLFQNVISFKVEVIISNLIGVR